MISMDYTLYRQQNGIYYNNLQACFVFKHFTTLTSQFLFFMEVSTVQIFCNSENKTKPKSLSQSHQIILIK